MASVQDGTFPQYVREEIAKAIHEAAMLHYKSYPPPLLTPQLARKFYIQPSDHKVLARAAEVQSMLVGSQIWRVLLEPHARYSAIGVADEYEGILTISLGAQKDFIWPMNPTKELPTREGCKWVEEVGQWWEHRIEVREAWSLVAGMVEVLDKDRMQPSLLKYLWPDFDRLLDLPSYRSQRARIWLQKFHDAGKPRAFEFPVPDFFTHMEAVRRTVLAMTMMPSTLNQHQIDQVLILGELNKAVRMPWADWLEQSRSRQGIGPTVVTVELE